MISFSLFAWIWYPPPSFCRLCMMCVDPVESTHSSEFGLKHLGLLERKMLGNDSFGTTTSFLQLIAAEGWTRFWLAIKSLVLAAFSSPAWNVSWSLLGLEYVAPARFTGWRGRVSSAWVALRPDTEGTLDSLLSTRCWCSSSLSYNCGICTYIALNICSWNGYLYLSF